MLPEKQTWSRRLLSRKCARHILAGAACLVASGCGLITNGSDSDRTAPTKLWFSPITDYGRSGWVGLPAFGDDIVLVAKRGGIRALVLSSGERRWDASLWASGYAANSDAIAVNGRRACMVDAWATGCVDISTGTVQWSREFAAADWRAKTGIDDFTWYVGSSAKGVANHRVYAFDPVTGSERWVADMAPAGQFKDTPTGVLGTVVSGDTVYATTVRWLTEQGGSMAGDMVALDRHTGRIHWSYTSPPPKGGFQGAALIHGRLAIVNDAYSHALVAIDRFTGKEVWRTEKNESGYINSENEPVLVGDTLFAASTDTQVYAVDARTGERIWRAFANRGSLGSLAVCGSQLLVTEFGGGTVVAMDRSTHMPRVLSGLEPGDYVTSQIGVKDGVAIFTSQQGVYAYRCS